MKIQIGSKVRVLDGLYKGREGLVKAYYPKTGVVVVGIGVSSLREIITAYSREEVEAVA